MANPGDLVRGMAKLLGMSEVYVGAFDRDLAKHGLRASNGRGSSAARMGSEDATSLLLAVMSGGQAKDAAVMVRLYARLQAKLQRVSTAANGGMISHYDYRSSIVSGALRLERIDMLPVGHSLFDVIDAMIFAAQFGEIEASVGSRKASATSAGFRTKGSWEMSIRITSPIPEAEVSIGCDELLSTCVYKDPSSHADGTHGDLLRETRVTQDTILGLGRLLRD